MDSLKEGIMHVEVQELLAGVGSGDHVSKDRFRKAVTIIKGLQQEILRKNYELARAEINHHFEQRTDSEIPVASRTDMHYEQENNSETPNAANADTPNDRETCSEASADSRTDARYGLRRRPIPRQEPETTVLPVEEELEERHLPPIPASAFIIRVEELRQYTDEQPMTVEEYRKARGEDLEVDEGEEHISRLESIVKVSPTTPTTPEPGLKPSRYKASPIHFPSRDTGNRNVERKHKEDSRDIEHTASRKKKGKEAIVQIPGRNVVGAVKLEFWGNDAPHDGQKIFMKQRTYRCTFFVVEDAEVDLTIGSRTIQDKGLAVRDMFDDFYALDGMNQGGFTFRHNPVGRELREEARRMQEERRAEYRRIRENAGYVPGPYSNAGN
ncbi:uncharacterized protein J3D65DRAFT_680160 [Phyllosticta citribraziliensis]|uniref:Uncharacterized protein n=1 Tax=Phyllosticta citribraziliensis TaxID=989973 RepID=A0ABR1LAW3_9PEZI